MNHRLRARRGTVPVTLDHGDSRPGSDELQFESSHGGCDLARPSLTADVREDHVGVRQPKLLEQLRRQRVIVVLAGVQDPGSGSEPPNDRSELDDLGSGPQDHGYVVGGHDLAFRVGGSGGRRERGGPS